MSDVVDTGDAVRSSDTGLKARVGGVFQKRFFCYI